MKTSGKSWAKYIDKSIKAKKSGYRKSSETGERYYEDRPNHSDSDPKSKYAKGGKMKKFSTGGLTGENARVKYLNDEYASSSLREEFKKKSKIKSDDLSNDYVIAFAYTDYGGDFFDKVAIAYFQKNYPKNIVVENSGYNGQNALVWGKPAEEYIEQTEDYPLGFDDIEELYYQMENEETYKSFEYYLDDLSRDYEFDKEAVMDWLMENKSGYYSIRTDGLDFSYSSLTDELEREDLIQKKYAKGGKTKKGKQDPPIVRGYFDDEPYEYGDGGLLGGFTYSIGGL